MSVIWIWFIGTAIAGYGAYFTLQAGLALDASDDKHDVLIFAGLILGLVAIASFLTGAGILSTVAVQGKP